MSNWFQVSQMLLVTFVFTREGCKCWLTCVSCCIYTLVIGELLVIVFHAAESGVVLYILDGFCV